MKKSIDESLLRMQTDYIDIFYIHFPDKNTPKNESIAALEGLRRQGKIRAIGVSNFSLGQIQEAIQGGQVDVVQGEYNLLNRMAEIELFPLLMKESISFIPYYPLASGLLTGKYTKSVTFPKEDMRSRQSNFQGTRFQTILGKIDAIRPIADKHETSVANIVLAFYLSQKGITAVIPGAKNSEQVRENNICAEIKLTPEELMLMNNIF